VKAALAPKRLLDPGPLRNDLAAAARAHGSAGKAELRPAIVKVLRAALESSHAAAEEQLLANGDGTRCAESLSVAEDEIIRSLFDLASTRLFPATGAEERIAVVAVGGYGRGTLAPGSDIDLLFVLPARQSERVQNIVEFILYCLWDTRQKVDREICLSRARAARTCRRRSVHGRRIQSFRALRRVFMARALPFAFCAGTGRRASDFRYSAGAGRTHGLS